MAHSPTYFYDLMIVEKNTMASLNALQPNIDNTQVLLSNLTSTSKVARWRLHYWLIATVAFTVEVSMDLAVLALEALARKSRYGTIPWYVNQAMNFQYGDTLVYINDQYQYAIIDETKKIIKRAAGEENGNITNIKVAALDGSGLPIPLDPAQKTAFDAYIQKIKPPGTTPVAISAPPDEVRLYIKVNFDPLLLDSNGQLISSPGTYPVNDAVTSFLANLSTHNFNGTLELCDLIDYIQLAAGVKTPYMLSASARYGLNPFVPFSERYHSNAGHLVIDAANPISSTVTYLPVNV